MNRNAIGKTMELAPEDMTPEETSAYRGITDAQAIAYKTATDAGWYACPYWVVRFQS